MSEASEVERPILQQLAALGWTVIDQGASVPAHPARSLRRSFREWMLPQVFDASVRVINQTGDGTTWLTEHQLEDLRNQLLRQPHRTQLKPMRRCRLCCSKPRSARTKSPANATRWCG